MLSKHVLFLCRAACVAALFFLIGCGSGDDDGRRLGELIVGTWLRGWGEGDVIIDGETDLEPENFTYDRFVFHDDGTYNGMVRKGTFLSTDKDGDIILEGNYQCDNYNLRLDFSSEDGGKHKILAQVLSFTDDTVVIQYVSDDYGVTVTITIRKLATS